MLLYFSFNKYDDRCNSITAMINKFLAQVLTQDQRFNEIIEAHLERSSHYSSWTQTDLLPLIQSIIVCHDSVQCVINGLNECDDSWAVFFSNICDLAKSNENRFKIVIISTLHPTLQSALAKWSFINLDDNQDNASAAYKDLISGFNLEVLELMQHRLFYLNFQAMINEKLLACGKDKYWRQLILTQLRLCKDAFTKAALQQELTILPRITVQETFSRILAALSPERRPWARKALTWILYAFRPLTVCELGLAIIFQNECPSTEMGHVDESDCQNTLRELHDIFKGIVIVQHNEVCLGHPDAREFFLNVNHGQEPAWYDVKKRAHQEISNACFLYLSTLEVQDPISGSYVNPSKDLGGTLPFGCRHNLHSYVFN